MVKSFSQISEDNVKLAIVGGDYGFKEELENLIEKLDMKERVMFPGVLTGKNKIEALVDCDIFIMPSRYESFTTSGLEAMACSKPLILTENNHIQSWVKDTAGLVCKFDEDELTYCIETLLADESSCQKFGDAGRKLIEDKYDWDKVSKQIESIYQDCISSY